MTYQMKSKIKEKASFIFEETFYRLSILSRNFEDMKMDGNYMVSYHIINAKTLEFYLKSKFFTFGKPFSIEKQNQKIYCRRWSSSEYKMWVLEFEIPAYGIRSIIFTEIKRIPMIELSETTPKVCKKRTTKKIEKGDELFHRFHYYFS